ncbi:MAG: hypothetical protein AB7P40_00315 [Chloroflexota bacterium]
MSASTLWLPTLGKEVPRPWFLPSAETLAHQRRILSSTYFLVRTKGNAGIGEALTCDPRKGGCGAKHEFLTLRCVPQPFSAITGGLYAYYRAIGDNGLERMLSPSERARFDAIKEQMPLMGLPDLATHHPEMARSLGLAPNDAQLSGLALGVLEPIPPTLARKYRDRINARGIKPKFSLPGMEH